MKKTKEEAEITRETILQASLKVFSENGYAATRLIDIAKEAGVTRGAIYWHFENKFDVLYNLVKDFRTGFQNEILEMISSGEKPESALYNVLIYIFKTTQNEEEFVKFEQLSSIMKELPDNSEKIINELKSQRKEFENKFEWLFKEILQSNPQLPFSQDFMARLYFSYIKGILMTWSEDKWYGESNFLPWEEAEKLASFFMKSLHMNENRGISDEYKTE